MKREVSSLFIHFDFQPNASVMSQEESPRTDPERSQNPKQFTWWKNPMLWGAACYIGFYSLLPMIPVQQELLTRYCTSHPIEYVTVGLFFLGMATLIIRWFDLKTESRALNLLRDQLESDSSSSKNKALVSFWKKNFRPFRHTIAGRRLSEGISLSSEDASREQLDQHLKNCSDLEHDLAQRQLGFVNTISWAVPILGFLGTVMGITLAIANVTPDQLDQSLPEVTSGLAVAFDTTALSLTLSLGLVFSTYIVRSKQGEILNQVEQQIDRQLAFILQQTGTESEHSTVSKNLVDASEQIVEQATELWRTELFSLQQRMQRSIEQEHLQFTSTLQNAFETTLNTHENHLISLQDQEQQRSETIGKQLSEGLDLWKESISKTGQELASQTEELQNHTALILNLVDKQHQLTEIQQQLHHSLDSSQITSTLDQTLNALTAAIQLLNARVNVGQRAA